MNILVGLTEQEFRHIAQIGDRVIAKADKMYSLAPHHRYITKGDVYQVVDTAVVESGFCFRTTTDIVNQYTYLSWQDLDMEVIAHGR